MLLLKFYYYFHVTSQMTLIIKIKLMI